jgi:hypothetical protein
MTIYPNDIDFQSLVLSYEKAKALFKEAKAKKKALKFLFNATIDEDDPNFISRTQYKKAQLIEKAKKISASIAKLHLKEKLKSFKPNNETVVAARKIEGIETVLFNNKYGRNPTPQKPKKIKDIKPIEMISPILNPLAKKMA